MSYPTFSHGNVRRHNSFGFVPGIKLTYKININSWLVSEPYLSFSTPFYSDNDNKLFDHIFHNDPGLIFTIGIRIGFNKVSAK